MFSSDSLIVGSRPSCREGVPFVEVLQIVFFLFLKWISSNAECSEMRLVKMVSMQWLEPFDEGQWLVASDRCLIAFSFCCCRDLSDFVSEVDLFAEQRSVSGVPPLALISQFVCHNCSVPGFTDGAGFRFGWMLKLLLLKQHLLFVTMS